MSFTEAQSWVGKLSCDSALHSTEAHKSERKKNLTKKPNQNKKPSPKPVFFKSQGGRGKKNIYFSGKSFGWWLFDKTGCAVRFLWTWHLQNELVAPVLSHKVDICHGRHWEEQTPRISNCAESLVLFPLGICMCLEGG